MNYVVRTETPSVEVYRHLRVAAGLSPKSAAAAVAGLAGTWHAVVVYYDDRPVGMGRVIGDGGTAFQIVDICGLPQHQGLGVGKRLMAALMEDLRERAPRTATFRSSRTATHATSTRNTASRRPHRNPRAWPSNCKYGALMSPT